MESAVIGLADAIEALRKELTEAIEQGRAQGMQFALEPIELTVETVVKADANGKVGWKLLLEAGVSTGSEATQTLKLKLKPVWRMPDGSLQPDFTIASIIPAGDHVGPEA